MKHIRTFHSLSSLLLKQQSNVYNKPLCEKRSEMLRFSRLPQEAATELHRSQWSFVGMRWIPLPSRSIVPHPHQQILVHAWHALHTWIVRFSGRERSVVLGFVREPMPTTCFDPRERVPRARPVRSSRGRARVRHGTASCN